MLKKRQKIVWSLLALIVSFAVFKMLVATKPELKKQQVIKHDPAVRVMLAKPMRQLMHVHSQGTVKAARNSKLIPEVSGKIVYLSPQMVNGGSMSKGDLLLAIEETDYALQLAQAKTQLLKAEIAANKAAAEFKRITALKTKKLASSAQYDQADERAQLTAAELATAKLRLQQAQLNLERTKIYAPFSGRVSRENVEEGQFISRGTTVADIYADDSLEVRLPISNREMAFLPVLEPSATAYPEVILTADFSGAKTLWKGHLIRTEAEIDAATRLSYAIVRVVQKEQSQALPVGLFVHADIAGVSVDDIVELPRTALRNDHQVLIVDEQDLLHFKQVKVLRYFGDKVLINKGLAEGDRVVTSPMQIVIDGMHIKPIMDNSVGNFSDSE